MDNTLEFDQLYSTITKSSQTLDTVAIEDLASSLMKGEIITLLEAKLTKRNKELFRKKYGDLPDFEMEKIFSDFSDVQTSLGNKDMFSYDSINELKEVITTTKAEKTTKANKKSIEKLLSKISNSRDKNQNGIGTLRDDKRDYVYKVLRAKYGDDLLDEDLMDVFDGFNELVRANTSKGIFEYTDIDALKTAITDGRNVGGNQITDDPDEGDSKKLYSDEKLMIYKVENYEDSKRFCNEVGNKGSWCVAYEGTSRYWDEYTAKGVEFVYVMFRDGNKYALALVDDGESMEVYDTADLIVSGYALVKQHPEIVEPIRNGGFPKFKSSEQYDVTKDKDGYTNVQEIMNGRIGSGRAVTVITRLDENDKFLDEVKHKTWAMKVIR